MNTIYINNLKEKVIDLRAELLKYDFFISEDIKREQTKKVYPENLHDHLLLEQALDDLADDIERINKEIKPYLK